MEAVYELAKSPPTHDFVNWLARAEYYRREINDPHMHVRVVPGERNWSNRDKQYTPERRAWRIENLLLPLARLVPSVASAQIAQAGKQEWNYSNPGHPVPPIFKAPMLARDIVAQAFPNRDRLVTLTLRNSDFEPQRNTRREEWEKLAAWLHREGYHPVFVPDGEAVMRGTSPELAWEQYHPASHTPALRLALYEHAKLNVMTNSGVMVMALYSDVPLVVMRLFVPGIPCCSVGHMKASGFAPERDWSATHKKTLHWEEDHEKELIAVVKQRLS